MPETRQELGIRTALNRMSRLANTPFSDCARPGSLLKSIQSSNFAEMINSMPSVHVLRAVSKTHWQCTRSLSKARRRNLPDFSRLTARYQDSDLSTSTTHIRY